MRRRTLSLLLAVAVVPGWPAGICSGAENSSARRPNIIYIMSDDHASHAMSCYGSRINKTPNLDRIANEGMLFKNCFCTNSICGPCRAVVNTGKYSHLNGFYRNGLTFDGSQQTVAKLLQESGYQTAMVGKWHLKSQPTGFDYWNVLIGQGPYYNPPMKTLQGTVKHTGYTTDVITDVALDFLKTKRAKGKPFFLMYQHKAPHRHWMPGPRHLNKYDDVTMPEPDNLFDDWTGRGTAARHQTMTIAEHLNPNDLKLAPQKRFTAEQENAWNKAYEAKNRAFQEANLKGDDLVRWKYQRYIKDYLRCIDSVDQNVGRLLDYLDRSGLAENTIVIYTSDQGFYLGDHGWFDKRFMYEESLRSPLAVRWPGHIEPGSVSDRIVLNLDFAETFLDVAGQPIPGDMQGRSLKPILQGKTPADWRTAMYYRYYEYPGAHMVHKHYGVRTERHKLIYFHELDEWELFDLEKDPREMKSVYDESAYAEVVKELTARLYELKQKFKDDDAVARQDVRTVRNPRKVKRELALHYDFAQVDGHRVPDSSGKGHHGELSGGRVVDGRRGKALKLGGKGHVRVPKTPESLSPDFRPLVIGAWCKPASEDGVVAAIGGESLGFSLFVAEGVPQFAVRSFGDLKQVGGPRRLPLGHWVHLAGAIGADGHLWLFVDGRPVADVRGHLIPRKPADVFVVGADTGSLVGQYRDPLHFSGLLEDFRLYWGVLKKSDLKTWVEENDE